MFVREKLRDKTVELQRAYYSGDILFMQRHFVLIVCGALKLVFWTAEKESVFLIDRADRKMGNLCVIFT